MNVYTYKRKDLKILKASEFDDGDVIRVSKYIIFIKYGDYGRPSMLSRVENYATSKHLGCTPGVDIPYYIDDFLSR